MTSHNWADRRRIHRDALRKLGKKESPQEKFDFMEQCVDAMQSEGVCDDDDEARQICELLWEQQADLDEVTDSEDF